MAEASRRDVRDFIGVAGGEAVGFTKRKGSSIHCEAGVDTPPLAAIKKGGIIGCGRSHKKKSQRFLANVSYCVRSEVQKNGDQ